MSSPKSAELSSFSWMKHLPFSLALFSPLFLLGAFFFLIYSEVSLHAYQFPLIPWVSLGFPLSKLQYFKLACVLSSKDCLSFLKRVRQLWQDLQAGLNTTFCALAITGLFPIEQIFSWLNILVASTRPSLLPVSTVGLYRIQRKHCFSPPIFHLDLGWAVILLCKLLCQWLLCYISYLHKNNFLNKISKRVYLLLNPVHTVQVHCQFYYGLGTFSKKLSVKSTCKGDRPEYLSPNKLPLFIWLNFQY